MERQFADDCKFSRDALAERGAGPRSASASRLNIGKKLVAVEVHNLAKRYRLAGARAGYKTLRDSVSRLFRRRNGDAGHPTKTLWALQDVSFDVPRAKR